MFAGTWNLIGSAAGTAWLLTVGRLAWNTRRPFAVFSLVVGIAGAVDATATALDLQTVSSVALQVHLYTVPIRAAGLGINLPGGNEIIRPAEPAAS